MKPLVIIAALAALAVGCADATPSSATDAAIDAVAEDIGNLIVPKDISTPDGGAAEISSTCMELCGDRECGTIDGCLCGTCEPTLECEDGFCATVCTPVCAADGIPYECGDDGMGATCGDCPAGDQWTCENHMCVCTPDCEGRVCGSDGCTLICGTCNDAHVCYAPDGLCYPNCGFEDRVFGGTAYKLNALSLATGGFPGEALDVDDDPETCAPAGACEGGLDASFANILIQTDQYVDMEQAYAAHLEAGDLVVLVELREGADGAIAAIDLYHGHTTTPLADCDWQTEACNYAVDPSSMHIPTCGPAWHFNAVAVDGDQLAAWGEDARFLVPLPLFSPTALVPLQLDHAQLRATLRADGVALDAGILAGAVHKQDLLDSMDSWPAEDLVVSPELIKGMLDMFVVPDIDLDGDGVLDAASVGFPFTAIAATLSGVAAD